MDPLLKRVYLFVAGILSLLLLALLLVALLRGGAALTSGSGDSPPRTVELSQGLSIPGFHFSSYKVQPQDTFQGIAAKFRLREETLRSLNQANDGGQPASSLIIPSQDAIFHPIRPGQGMGDLARAYGIPLRDILRANQKRGDGDLKGGEILVLPGAPYLSRKDPRWIRLGSLATSSGFLKPTTGRFADGFGERIHPLTGKRSFHEGLDLAPGRGAKVVATQTGMVLSAGIRAGYGRLVVLDHGGGITSWYAHLDEILVKSRQQVARGELIGKVGLSGKTTGPHLHFEVRKDGKPQNPFLYLAQ